MANDSDACAWDDEALLADRQRQWTCLHSSWPHSDAAFFATSMVIGHEIMFLGLSTFFAACTHFGFLQQYRLPRKGEPSSALTHRALMSIAVTHVVVQWPLLWWSYPLLERTCADV